MNILTKRLSFWTLVILFIIDSVFVYTIGTEEDKGRYFLSEPAKEGKLLYQKYNCTACHQLYGLGGYMGPDLTNVASEKGKGELYIRAFLQNGTQRMPDFHLDDKEISSITGYLKYVDKTGISPLKNFEIKPDGTVIYK